MQEGESAGLPAKPELFDKKKAAAYATALVRLNEPVFLEPPVVLDSLSALDAARHFGGFGSGCRGTDEAAQLHGALIGFNVDFSRFQCRFADDGGLHLGSDHHVLDVF